MAELAGVHLSSTEVDWRALLRPLEARFEELATPEVPLISFQADLGGSDLPQGMGTLEESDGYERVLVREGVFPGNSLPTNAGMGYFSIPADGDRAISMATWEKFCRYASRAWSVLPDAIRAPFDLGGDEFRWIAVVCAVHRKAGTAVSFSYPKIAGIRHSTGCAAASAMAIQLLCQGAVNLDSTFFDAPALVEGDAAKLVGSTPQSHIVSSVTAPDANLLPLSPFTGGILAFLPDRVELCGVDICSGRRSNGARRLLDLLRIQGPDQLFVAYSGVQLAAKFGQVGKADAMSALVGRLQKRVSAALRDRAGIDCSLDDVILTRGAGYRLSQNLTVRIDESLTDDHGQCQGDVSGHVRNDVRNVPKLNVHKPGQSANRGRSTPGERQGWIIQQLRVGNRIGAPEVAQEFQCSRKTADRDIARLKDAGQIRFEGAPTTGAYWLNDTTQEGAVIS